MRIYVKGMSCEHCKKRVEKALESIPEIKEVSVNLNKGTANVKTVNNNVDKGIIKNRIEETGYKFGGIE
ncbi:MAG: cation transporter [Kosmotogaceae bacterium]